jgi:hypothetical protein
MVSSQIDNDTDEDREAEKITNFNNKKFKCFVSQIDTKHLVYNYLGLNLATTMDHHLKEKGRI